MAWPPVHRYPPAGSRRVAARRRTIRAGVAGLTVLALLATDGFLDPAWATSWSIHAGSPKSAAKGGSPPAPPATVTATCGTGGLSDTIKVSWSASSRATSYTVYESTTSSSSGYSVAASGVAGLSWTTSNLVVVLSTTYWFEVAAVTGSYWQGSNSGASNSRTISVLLVCT